MAYRQTEKRRRGGKEETATGRDREQESAAVRPRQQQYERTWEKEIGGDCVSRAH